ncbi:MAG: hypothetical protein IKP28_00120 [Clostridia bacterium]|nr:hypothetical protein [Clostridia bacterium]
MKKKNENHYLRNTLIGLIGLAIAVVIFTIAPDYTRTDITSKTNVIINNNNITSSLKKDVYVDSKGVIYMSKQDLANFFDSFIYYDEKYNQIITTSDTKVATFPIDSKEITINGVGEHILGACTLKDDTYYLPFSEMGEVYNIEIEYIKETDRVVVVSKDRQLEKADAANNLSVKWKQKVLSRTVDKVGKGEKVVVISVGDNGWAKIRTQRGQIGYVKESDLANRMIIRENMENNTRLAGKVSLVWDYYSEYASAPNRNGETIEGINVISPSFFTLVKLGKGEIHDNAKTAGENYVAWAKSQGYKVWALFANNVMIETTHEILNDFKLRETTIRNIVNLAARYKVDGINLDFENIYEEDKDLFTRFVVELYPRLHEYGLTLSVDVTAPDGSPTWSLCFDRYNISKNCDYLIFMAYDEYGLSSTTAGTTAGYDWVEVNLNKFLRDIPSEKIILGIPFYTRTWKIGDDKDTASTVSMRNINSVLPSGANIVWKEAERQNYAEYTKNGASYKMWIEDEKSITEKLNLSIEKNTAGVAFWMKGYETNEIWSVIRQKILE